jgi:hypothetical protein
MANAMEGRRLVMTLGMIGLVLLLVALLRRESGSNSLEEIAEEARKTLEHFRTS